LHGHVQFSDYFNVPPHEIASLPLVGAHLRNIVIVALHDASGEVFVTDEPLDVDATQAYWLAVP